jgi:hypothetical protein
MASILKQSGMAMLAVVAFWAAVPRPAFAQRLRPRFPPPNQRRQDPGGPQQRRQDPRGPDDRPHHHPAAVHNCCPHGPCCPTSPCCPNALAPAWGWGGWWPGSDFEGAAELIRAQGDYELAYQEARLLNQEVEQAKVETRRHIYDEWLEERAKRPTLQDEVERSQNSELRRALKNPPVQEIVSGYALNIILQDLGARQSKAVAGPATAIDQQLLQHVNVTVRGGGSTGILKGVRDGGTLSWPMPLRGDAYEEETGRIDEELGAAIRGAPDSHTIDPDTLNDLLEDLGLLRSELSKHADELTPSDHVQAKRFLDQLGEALRGLQQPGALDRLREKLVPEGRTVPELVRFMTAKGLVFAPAAAGDDAAYMALYNALASNRNASPMPAAQE